MFNYPVWLYSLQCAVRVGVEEQGNMSQILSRCHCKCSSTARSRQGEQCGWQAVTLGALLLLCYGSSAEALSYFSAQVSELAHTD